MKAGNLTFIGSVRLCQTCCSTENALSIYLLSGGKKENLPFQNYLSVPDRPTRAHDVTQGATFVCYESTVFVLLKLNLFGYRSCYIFPSERFVDYLVFVT